MDCEVKVNRRDEFALDIKDLLAKRVGMRCSNPNCRHPTSGPQADPKKALNIGVAAHITAAAVAGPRFERGLTSGERCSFENGIWLCQNCAKLIDNDTGRYTVDLLLGWRRLAEQAALLAVESPNATAGEARTTDAEMIRFFSQCFDRPAFQDYFRQEGSMEAFDTAIEDTITAINTGCLRSRDGAVLSQSKGKAFLRNQAWRERMDTIVDLLRAIRSRYDLALKTHQIHVSRGNAEEWYCIHDSSISDWMDHTRGEVLRILAEVCHEAGVTAPRFPRPVRPWH